jgi:hypothetical protein
MEAGSGDRIRRALSEDIALTEQERVDGGWRFQVSGATGGVYSLTIAGTAAGGLELACSCADFAARGRACKHLIYIIARGAAMFELAAEVGNATGVGSWVALNAALEARLGTAGATCATCAICLEAVAATAGSDLPMGCRTCRKPFHGACITQWLERVSTCPLCRAEFGLVAPAAAVPAPAVPADVAAAPVPPAAPVPIDVVFVFDTTGSMYPCIREVRRFIAETAQRLFAEIPELRIAVLAHGDYCDRYESYLTKHIDFSNSAAQVTEFVTNVGGTSGGDAPEAYEYALRECRRALSWRDMSTRAIVLIGDATPHEPEEVMRMFGERIDWREELEALADRATPVFAVQCADYPSSKRFFAEAARVTNGYHLRLTQFAYIRDLIAAICFRLLDPERLLDYEREIQLRGGGLNAATRAMFDVMLARAPAAGRGRAARAPAAGAAGDEPAAYAADAADDLPVRRAPAARAARAVHRRAAPAPVAAAAAPAAAAPAAVAAAVAAAEVHPCAPGKFQVFEVEAETTVKNFCADMGIVYVRGMAFYEFTKIETIQADKLIVLMHSDTGELYEGGAARALAGIPAGEARLRPAPGYRIFVQSKAPSRKLVAGTGFLYERVVDG